ncbi:MAG: Hsp33 family molecular chaperone HslO [Bdellovibrionales bacterium]|nr:Hsp33 family molecular chaperone HslO [Bdellovibrionales bacterium]
MAGKDEVRKYLSAKQGLRATFTVATHVVREMQSIQNTYPVASLAVGRSMVAAILLASVQKKGQVVSLHFKGDGPLDTFIGEATFEGEVRGYTKNPQLEVPLIDHKILVGPAIGKGTLTVVRTFGSDPAQKGSVEIQTGEVGDDVAYFLHKSDQIRSLVTLGVKVNAYGKVEAAGGVLIELMPDYDEAIVDLLMNNSLKVASISELIAAGGGALELKDLFLKDIEVHEIDHPHELTYTCRCSKARLIQAMELFPVEDLEDILRKGKEVEAKCEICGRVYEISLEKIEEIKNKVRKTTLH